MSEEQAYELAKQFMREGRCTDNNLRKQGIPQSQIHKLIHRAEAWYVNQVTQLFPKPPQYEEQDYGPEQRHQ